MQQHISLRSFNTFGIDVSAAAYTELHTPADLQTLIREGYTRTSHLFLGGGSNVLFTRDFDGLVLRNCLKGIHVVEEDAHTVLIEAAGGEVWHHLVMFTVERGWGGIENLSLIPGTVGAAPMQNIGAYGVELNQVFEELTAVHIQTGEQRTFNKQDCAFGYRESVFKKDLKGQYFIQSVRLRLQKQPQVHIAYGAIKDVLAQKHITLPRVQDVSEAVIAIRQSKLPDPRVLGNAGSFFKNPEIPEAQYHILKQSFPAIPGYPAAPGHIKVPAGWLIEQCGWKGKRVGNTGAHKDQALVLVNYGGATGAEILALAYAIQESVQQRFGITITPEVNII